MTSRRFPAALPMASSSLHRKPMRRRRLGLAPTRYTGLASAAEWLMAINQSRLIGQARADAGAPRRIASRRGCNHPVRLRTATAAEPDRTGGPASPAADAGSLPQLRGPVSAGPSQAAENARAIQHRPASSLPSPHDGGGFAAARWFQWALHRPAAASGDRLQAARGRPVAPPATTATSQRLAGDACRGDDDRAAGERGALADATVTDEDAGCRGSRRPKQRPRATADRRAPLPAQLGGRNLSRRTASR